MSAIKISPKRLKSGKFQVKFDLEGPMYADRYGYLLVESGASVREVIFMIRDRLEYNRRIEATGYHPAPMKYNDIIIFRNGNHKRQY